MNELSCRIVMVFSAALAGTDRVIAAAVPVAASLRNRRRVVG
jgi:hypothetical protein